MKPVLPQPKESCLKCPSGCFLVDGANIARTTLERCKNLSRGRSMMCGKCGMLINDDTIVHSCGNRGRGQSPDVSWDVSGMSLIKTTIDWKLGHIDVTAKNATPTQSLTLIGKSKRTLSISPSVPRDAIGVLSKSRTVPVGKQRRQSPPLLSMSELLLLGDIPPTDHERTLSSSHARLFPSTIPTRLIHELLNGHSVEPLVELPRLKSSTGGNNKGSKRLKSRPTTQSKHS